MRTRVVRDPEWTEDDALVAQEWLDYKASLCQCGHPRGETFDPKAEGKYEAEALKCHACAARDLAQTRWREDEHARTEGLFFATRRVDDED